MCTSEIFGEQGSQMAEYYTQNDPNGTVFKTKGEDMLNRFVTSDGPSLSTIMEALQFNYNNKV
jgi:hypothetical protein